MLDALLAPTTVPLLEQSAAFGERRHEVLAGNVANVDTPHYRRKDLDTQAFTEALKAAIDARKGSTPSRYTLPEVDPSAHFHETLHAVRTAGRMNPTFQDGAERSIEADVLTMTRNLMQQTLSVELMSAQLGLLGSVISEQP